MRAGRLAVAGFLALALGGCASTDPETEDDRSATRQAYDRAFAQWTVRRPSAYRFVLQRSCFCTEDFRAAARVTVRNGVIVSAERLDGGAAVVSTYRTVDELFEEIDEAIDDDAWAVRVTYDATWGYPTDVYIDHDLMIADEETSYSARDLAPL